MAFLRRGQFTALREHGRLVEEVKSFTPKPRRDASDKDWANWSMSQNQAHEMSVDRLRRVIQSELVKNSDIPVTRRLNYATCQRCRGYRLERQWCEACGGKGLVEVEPRDFAAEIHALLRGGRDSQDD